jgi:hypothetical protein
MPLRYEWYSGAYTICHNEVACYRMFLKLGWFFVEVDVAGTIHKRDENVYGILVRKPERKRLLRRYV